MWRFNAAFSAWRSTQQHWLFYLPFFLSSLFSCFFHHSLIIRTNRTCNVARPWLAGSQVSKGPLGNVLFMLHNSFFFQFWIFFQKSREMVRCLGVPHLPTAMACKEYEGQSVLLTNSVSLLNGVVPETPIVANLLELWPVCYRARIFIIAFTRFHD
jgi:hypothetical protein